MPYLRRLATTGAAYTAYSIASKAIAVFLLPLYTRYLTPSDYGAVEVLVTAVITASIVIRFGMIEAILRFAYLDEVERSAVVGTGFAALAWAATIAAAIGLAFAGPISNVLLGHTDAELGRIAIGGLWGLTLWEYVLALLRIEERARAYLAITMANVLVTIPLTVWLVVLERDGARGLLIATYVTIAPFIAYRLWEERARLRLIPDRTLLRRMVRFGFPTMPAEVSVYSLNFIDRLILARSAGLAAAGLYALAVRFAQGMNVIARAFQLAWPPIAYSIADDEEARGAYALVFTWFTAVCAFFVAGFWLDGRWAVRLLAAPDFFGAHRALPLLATGIGLYALYLVQVIILGRTGRTELSFAATGAGMVVNVGLNVALVPSLDVVGAGLALVGSYLVVGAITYGVTQRVFAVPYEWRRLGLAVGLAAALAAIGELALPTSGAVGLAARTTLWLAYPPLLAALGFLTPAERAELAPLLRPRAVRARLRGASAAAPAPDRSPAYGAEVYEAAIRDEDSR
jgi:O-antigen/teichoic acid export membrane protein